MSQAGSIDQVPTFQAMSSFHFHPLPFCYIVALYTLAQLELWML